LILSVKIVWILKVVIRLLHEISVSAAYAKLELVFYTQSSGMIVKDRMVIAGEIAKLMSNKNIV